MEVEFVIKKKQDDLYAALSDIVAEIIRQIPGHDRARIIGYTLISPPSLPPVMFRVIGNDDRYRLSCETIESGT
jgi:hypothetical protein